MSRWFRLAFFPFLILLTSLTSNELSHNSKSSNAKVYFSLSQLYIDEQGMSIELDGEFIPVDAIYQDEEGYFVHMSDPRCPKGHIGILWVKDTWYCMDGDCPYFIGENFYH